MKGAPRIVVVGSINRDLVIQCEELPRPGQTRIAKATRYTHGGKGANQAVAAARAGGQVAMIGRVGDDALAAPLLANLQGENINCEAIGRTPNCDSGLAVVAVESSGENAILVSSGANNRLRPADIGAARNLIAQADILLLQLEIPLDSVLAAIEIARDAGVRILLDPAPAPTNCPDELLAVDLLCPNESEAAALAGAPVTTWEQAESAADELLRRGAANIVITLGARGALLRNKQESHRIDPFPTNPVDTTAAGDAFAGTLAVAWASGSSLVKSARLASAAAALAVSREGAQASMPRWEEIENLYRVG